MRLYRSLHLRTLTQTSVGAGQVPSTHLRMLLSTCKAAPTSTPTPQGLTEVNILSELYFRAEVLVWDRVTSKSMSTFSVIVFIHHLR